MNSDRSDKLQHHAYMSIGEWTTMLTDLSLVAQVISEPVTSLTITLRSRYIGNRDLGERYDWGRV